MKKLFFGVDPGKSGAIAVLKDGEIIDVITMPMAGKDIDLSAISDWITMILLQANANSSETVVCIEKVSSMPRQGISSTFNFGFNTGAIHGLFAAHNIPRMMAMPQQWQKVVLEGVTRDKGAAISYCRRLYPNVSLLASERSRKPHTGISDAICIATYAQLKSLA